MHDQSSHMTLENDEAQGGDPGGEKEQRPRGNVQRLQKLPLREDAGYTPNQGRSGSGRDHSGMSERPRKV